MGLDNKKERQNKTESKGGSAWLLTLVLLSPDMATTKPAQEPKKWILNAFSMSSPTHVAPGML